MFTPADLQRSLQRGFGLVAAGGLREGVGLKGEEVPFDGFFGLGSSASTRRARFGLTALRTGSRETGGKSSLEVVPADGPKQRAAHFARQLVGGEPFGRAGGGPVALTGEAGVSSGIGTLSKALRWRYCARLGTTKALADRHGAHEAVPGF
jgi:hypothetical protein